MSRSAALRILAIAFAIGLLAQALLFESLLGINVPILVIGFLGAAWVVRPRDGRIDPADRWLPAAAVLVGLAVALRADPLLLVLDVLSLCALIGASVAAIGGAAVTRRSVVRIVELGFLVIGWAGVGIVRVAALVARRDPDPDADPGAAPRGARVLPAWAAPVARGLVIAIPLLFVFAGLFSAADFAFDELMGRLFSWDLDLGMIPVRLAFAVFVAWGVAGLLGVAGGSLADDRATVDLPPARVPRSLGAAAAGLPAGADPAAGGLLKPIRLGAIEAATILVAVDVLFGLFVLVQLRYLFGGQDSLSVTGEPYAQYARSGFFELVWVAFLAGGLITVLHAVAARRTPLLVGSAIALAALTGAILVSALIRLRIYQDAYGWTELRFYVLASIVWLGAGIAITITLLARDRMRWLLQSLAIAAVVVLVGINVVGPSRLIAEENVARVLNPALVPPDGQSGLDIGYASALGDDAVPALVRALPTLDGDDRAVLLRWLERRRSALVEPDATGWPSWNLGRQAAHDALVGLPDR
jgi:hypothetical protein